ncbi:YjdF family protein [Nocardia transvalensis]|uniref:YjdF family protein n=1 Tax=Nocardia transvalensis TaxID=37333 RepID=UPI001894BACB|nr:YjdF family protein [Nocardia transvalensis]MBF6330066.1 YjdF family protein [Nocardia transvalensis]
MPSTFSVFYDGQFWVGVLEITDGRGVRAARHVFGAEPSNAELEEFAVKEYGRLLDRALTAPPVPVESRSKATVNPKRLARLAAREQAARPISSAAQDALRLAHEQAGHENRAAAKRRRAIESDQRRDAVARKRKAKRRGH